MPLFSFEGRSPLVHPNAWIAPTGTPAVVRGPLTAGARWWVDNNPQTYRELARRHAQGSR